MFGYILADTSAMNPFQLERYQGCYCGLCRVIGQDFGQWRRMALNYDMTFLALVLNAMEEPEETQAIGRCVVHPTEKKSYWHSEVTHYCAAMTVALTYYKCLDDWQDDRNLPKLCLAKTFQGPMGQIRGKYPRQLLAIEKCITELSAMERENRRNPDEAANLFGTLMGELFVLDTTDFFAKTLRQLGESLGRFVYLMDAVCDLPEDRKKGRYNPLLDWGNDNKETYEPYLNLHLGEAISNLEKLPIVQDLDILNNILYRGVWLKYNQTGEPKEGSQCKTHTQS